MKKMTTPEMNVIRFNEADVIVASGDTITKNINVSGIRNGTAGDARINYKNTSYDYDAREILNVTLIYDGLHFFYNDGSGIPKSFGDMLYYEEDPNETSPEYNGTWVYDSEKKYFVKKN